MRAKSGWRQLHKTAISHSWQNLKPGAQSILVSLSNFTILTIPSLAHCCRHSAGPISGMSRSQSPHTQVNLKFICDAHRTPRKSAPSRQQLRSYYIWHPLITHSDTQMDTISKTDNTHLLQSKAMHANPK